MGCESEALGVCLILGVVLFESGQLLSEDLANYLNHLSRNQALLRNLHLLYLSKEIFHR